MENRTMQNTSTAKTASIDEVAQELQATLDAIQEFTGSLDEEHTDELDSGIASEIESLTYEASRLSTALVALLAKRESEAWEAEIDDEEIATA